MWNSVESGESEETQESEESQESQKSLLYWQYDIKKCVYWILFNNYNKVCLQFPDELLVDAPDIALILEKKIRQKLYIMADTTFGSCCVDSVAAKHINADAIIHFGRACLTSQDSIPTLYVLPKVPLDVKSFCKVVIEIAEHIPHEIILLYDVSFEYATEDIITEVAVLKSKIRVSRLATPQQNREGVKWASSDILVTKLGRIFSVPSTADLDCLTYIYLSDKHHKKNLDNFVYLYPNSSFYCYEIGTPDHFDIYQMPEVAKRRLFLIQKIKEVNNIGILISTLSTEKYIDAIERVKQLCKLKNKKSYIISVGKINVAKLANFPEIDVFVMIACPEVEIPKDQDFYQPIVTVMELELALNKNEVWWQNTISDFREFLPGGKMFKEIDKTADVLYEVDVSLISSNRALTNNLVDKEMPNTGDNAIAVRNPMAITESNINEGLMGRSWQGLQLNIDDTPIERVTSGLKGTPSGGYHYPSSSSLT